MVPHAVNKRALPSRPCSGGKRCDRGKRPPLTASCQMILISCHCFLRDSVHSPEIRAFQKKTCYFFHKIAPHFEFGDFYRYPVGSLHLHHSLPLHHQGGSNLVGPVGANQPHLLLLHFFSHHFFSPQQTNGWNPDMMDF